MTKCRDCGEEKSYLEFRGDTDLCRKCSTKSAVATRIAMRDDLRPHGQYKGDIIVCATCGKSFTIKRTVKKTRKVCSIKCNRPTKDSTERGLELMRELSAEQKEARAKKTGAKLKGRAGRGRQAKGTRNAHAKFYELRAPDRTLYEFKNLRHFVRTHPDLFSADELRTYKSCSPGTTYAETALRLLFSLTKDGDLKVNQWHGWTIGDKSEQSLKMRKRKRDEIGRYAVTHNAEITGG